MAKDKPRGRLARNYRLTWVDDSGFTASVINPPVSPARLAHLTVGGLAGTPVDAFVATVGQCAGYTLSYPTKVEGMEFLVDRLNAGAALGGGVQWRSAENLRRLWADGHDPGRIVMDEAHRLGMDFWLQLRMNDWHHVDSEGKVYRLIGSDYYESHPELLIGAEGVAGWPESLQESLAWFQDFAHEKVRRIRLDTATEAIERYDAEGWEYDFMRCPGLFKYGTERANAHLVTELIRDTRRMLDEVGRARGKTLGLSVRVPNTIAGAAMLGLDVEEWVADHLVDIVVPSTFFAQDTEEDMREWVKLAAGTPVLIHPTIEEGFITGRRAGYGIPYYQVKSDPMQAMTVEMIRGLAARHHAAGVDGLYLFNYQGTWTTYGYDNSPALDDMASPLRLRFKDKRYVVMRRNGSFPNCFPQERQIPAELGPEPVEIGIEIADDFADAGARLRSVHLKLLLVEPCHEDRLEVRLNGGEPLPIANPMAAGRAAPFERAWAVFDLTQVPPRVGVNRISVRVQRHPRLAEELPLVLSDVEIDVSYRYPNALGSLRLQAADVTYASPSSSRLALQAQLVGEVAGGEVPVAADRRERRQFLFADRLPVRAAGMEQAAARHLRDLGYLAFQDDALQRAVRIGPRDAGEERLRIGVLWGGGRSRGALRSRRSGRGTSRDSGAHR